MRLIAAAFLAAFATGAAAQSAPQAITALDVANLMTLTGKISQEAYTPSPNTPVACVTAIREAYLILSAQSRALMQIAKIAHFNGVNGDNEFALSTFRDEAFVAQNSAKNATYMVDLAASACPKDEEVLAESALAKADSATMSGLANQITQKIPSTIPSFNLPG